VGTSGEPIGTKVPRLKFQKFSEANFGNFKNFLKPTSEILKILKFYNPKPKNFLKSTSEILKILKVLNPKPKNSSQLVIHNNWSIGPQGQSIDHLFQARPDRSSVHSQAWVGTSGEPIGTKVPRLKLAQYVGRNEMFAFL